MLIDQMEGVKTTVKYLKALIQSNAVSIVMNDIFNIKSIFFGIMTSTVIFLIVVGGVRRLGKVTEKLLPFMTSIYFLGGLIVIFFNINHLLYVIMNLVNCAFRTEGEQ